MTDREEMESLWWWHHIELPELGMTPGHEPNPEQHEEFMKIPDRFQGNVLDIGAWDGKYSFLAEQRGAAVVRAVDLWDTTKTHATGEPLSFRPFDFARKHLKSKVQALHRDVLDLGMLSWADTVLFMGVLYHLRHPMLAIERISKAMKSGGLLILETATFELHADPMLLLTPNGFDGDPSNVWYPNSVCVVKMLEMNDFTDIKKVGGFGNTGMGRWCFHARRK